MSLKDTAFEVPNDSQKTSSADSLRSELPPEIRRSLRRASDLKHHLQARDRSQPLPTSITALDDLLGGGFEPGRLTEMVGRASCGRFAAIMAALRAVTGAGEAAALIDQGAQFDPQHASRAGIELDCLLWLRPSTVPDALAAAEMLVRTGFGLIALDFGLPPVRGRAPLAAWLRLARSCAEHETIVLVGAPYRLSGCAADAVVQASTSRGRWSGSIGSPRLLEGLHSTLELARRRGHRPQNTAMIHILTPEADITHNSAEQGFKARTQTQTRRKNHA